MAMEMEFGAQSDTGCVRQNLSLIHIYLGVLRRS